MHIVSFSDAISQSFISIMLSELLSCKLVWEEEMGCLSAIKQMYK